MRFELAAANLMGVVLYAIALTRLVLSVHQACAPRSIR